MKYSSMILCPDSEAGELALHEAIQDGWEPLICYRENGGELSDINHIVLRKKSKPTRQRRKRKPPTK